MTAARVPAWHGTLNGYQYHRCKCSDCRRANREDQAQQRATRYARTAANGGIAPIGAHGTTSTYNNWGCECVPCIAANSRKTAARRARVGR